MSPVEDPTLLLPALRGSLAEGFDPCPRFPELPERPMSGATASLCILPVVSCGQRGPEPSYTLPTGHANPGLPPPLVTASSGSGSHCSSCVGITGHLGHKGNKPSSWEEQPQACARYRGDSALDQAPGVFSGSHTCVPSTSLQSKVSRPVFRRFAD